MEKSNEMYLQSTKSYIEDVSTNTIIFDKQRGCIDVDVELIVSDIGFYYTKGDCYIINDGDLKGIVFGYYNTNPTLRDNANMNTNRKMVISDDIYPNSIGDIANWQNGDSVRLMVLNETSEDEFKKMRKYFELYLKIFRFDPVKEHNFVLFNIFWNSTHESEEQINFDYPSFLKKIDIFNPFLPDSRGPRYTKDGGVLTLKLRN